MPNLEIYLSGLRELAMASILPAGVGPAVLVEAASGRGVAVDPKLLALAVKRWNTAVIDRAAVQAVLGGERPLAHQAAESGDCIDELSEVYELRKSSRNASPHICLGRGKRNDVVVNDFSVSTRHAHFEDVGEGRYHITDMGSRNGTFVNQLQVSPTNPVPLTSGDCIRLGKALFYFLEGRDFKELLLNAINESAPGPT